MSIITYPLNNITYNAEDAETYLCTRTSGVFSAEGCFSATATGSDRTVTISKGIAWIKNDDYRGKSICSTADTAIDIPLATGGLSRIDRIVLRFDTNYNASMIALKQGTPSPSPVAPAVEQTPTLYELGLCEISVKAGTVFVEQKDITSTLLDEQVCGVMTDGVKGIPTQQLFDKFSSDFNDWFKNIQSQLSGDVATNLQNQINEINETIESYSTKFIPAEQKGAKSGVASLDSSGKVPKGQLPSLDYIPTSQKGKANGVATLGSNSKVPNDQLPIGAANGIPSLGPDGKIVSTYLPEIGGKMYMHICKVARTGDTAVTASIFVISDKATMTTNDIWDFLHSVDEQFPDKGYRTPYPANGLCYKSQQTPSHITQVYAIGGQDAQAKQFSFQSFGTLESVEEPIDNNQYLSIVSIPLFS